MGATKRKSTASKRAGIPTLLLVNKLGQLQILAVNQLVKADLQMVCDGLD